MTAGRPHLHVFGFESPKSPNVSVIIDREALRAVAQVIDYFVNGSVVGAKNDAVVDIRQEDHRAAVIKARVKFAWCKANFAHSPVHVLIPYSPGLFRAIHVVSQLESMCFSCHTVVPVPLRQPHI